MGFKIFLIGHLIPMNFLSFNFALLLLWVLADSFRLVKGLISCNNISKCQGTYDFNVRLPASCSSPEQKVIWRIGGWTDIPVEVKLLTASTEKADSVLYTHGLKDTAGFGHLH
jgi:hypothetical protein